MAKNYIDYEKAARLGAGDTDVQLYAKVIKLQEEAGEVGQAFLCFDQQPNVSASAKDVDGFGVLEECCDVINCAMEVINAMGFTDEQAKEMFDKKLDKWEAKQKARK